MALATITICVLAGLGITAAGGTAAYFWNRNEVELEELEARLKQIKAEIEGCQIGVERLRDVKGKVKTAVNYLENGRSTFQHGGHVLGGTPLCSTEFAVSISKLNSSISGIETNIGELNKEITELIKERNQINIRKNELLSKKNKNAQKPEVRIDEIKPSSKNNIKMAR